MPYATPTVIEDFIKTATAGEIDALRPAVCQYFGGKTLMRVHTSVSTRAHTPTELQFTNINFRSKDIRSFD